MIKHLYFVLLLCALMLPQPCGAANLLSNPGFEEGATFANGWFSWGDCGVEAWAARHGTNGVALYGWISNGNAGFWQDVPVTSHALGDIYTFSMDALPEQYFGSSSGHISLNIDCLAGETITTTFVVNVYAILDSHRGTWVTLTASYTNFDTTINTVRVSLVAADFSPLGEGLMACMWDNASFEIVNLAEPRLILSGDATIYAGCSNEWSVQRNSVDAGDLAITVTSSSPSVVSVPSDVTILAGTTSATFFVTGLTTGDANVLVSADGWQDAQMTANVAMQNLVLTGNEYFHVGNTNTWTVTRYGPQTADAIVHLSNSSPSVVSAPSQVVLAAGSSSTSFSVTGQAVGTGTLIADSENFQAGSRDFAVLARTLSFVWPGTLYSAVTNECMVTRHDSVSGDLVVSLSNSAPSVVNAPTSVTIGDGESNATFLVAGRTAGSASLWAYAPGYESTGTLVVVAANGLSLGGGYIIPLAGSNLWTVTREGALQESLQVTLDIDDPDVIGIPDSVTIAPLAATAAFYVSGRGAWTGTVTASAVDYPSAMKSAMVSRSILQNPGFDDGYGFVNGWFSWGNCSVEPWAAHAGTNGVAFHGWVEGAFGGFAQDVPITSHAEGDIYTLSIDGMAEDGFNSSSGNVVLQMLFLQGETIRTTCEVNIYSDLTASRGTWNRHSMTCTNRDVLADTLRVVCAASDYNPQGYLVAAMWDNADLALVVGSESNLYLEGGLVYEGGTSVWIARRSGSLDEPLTVTLTSLDTNIASVSSPVLIPAGTNITTFEIAGVSLGTTAIKATAPGCPSTWQPVAIRARGLLLAGTANLYAASTNQWTITRTGPANAALEVTLTSSRPQTIAVPASISLGAGSTSAMFDVICSSTGSAILTASAPGFASTSSTLTVSQRFLEFSGATQLYAGLSNAWTLTRHGPVTESLVVALSNDAPDCATAPDSVTLDVGNSSATFWVSAVQHGTAHIATVASGYPSTAQTMTVLPNSLTLAGLLTVAAGHSNRWSVTRTGPLSAPVTVDLAVDQPTIADAPKDLVIPAETNTACFFVQGLQFGTATVTATASGLLPAELALSVTDNLLRNPGFEESASWGDAWLSWGDIAVEYWAAETGDRGVAMFGWIEGSHGGFLQDVATTASAEGDVYVFSMNARRDPDFHSSNGTVHILLQFLDENMLILSTVTNAIYADFAAQAAESWNTYTVSAINTNAAAQTVRAIVYAANYAPSGGLCAAMWDNACLQKHALVGSNLLLTGRSSGYEGTSNLWLVTRIGPRDESLSITLSSDESSVATVASPVEIPAGAASAPITVVVHTNPAPTARRFGGDPLGDPMATITAQATGYPPTNKAIVAQGNVLQLSGQTSVFVSFSNRWTVSRSGPLGSSLSIALASTAPDVVSLPASVDISSGSASADFYITAQSPGTASITAEADGCSSTSRVATAVQLAPDIATDSADTGALSWMGTAGCRYLVEEALNLNGPWAQVRNIHCSQAGQLEWQDAGFANATSKYYRILTIVTNAPDGAYTH